MSIADACRMAALEAAVAELLARVAALEELIAEARRPDPAMAGVVEALEAGQSIRGAAQALNLDRNKVARLRQRAIAAGRLAVSPTEP